MGQVAIALDIGGTKLAGALVQPDGTVVHERIDPCPHDARGRDPELAGTLALATDLVAAAADRGLEPAAIGAGFPEYTGADGRLRSTEVLAWTTQPAELLAGLGVARVVIESDVRCGAVAEARLGAGRGAASALYVSVGTGLSSTLVLDGIPLAGARGEAIALTELDCPDGGGRLEPRVSGVGLTAAYVQRAGGGPVDAEPSEAAAVRDVREIERRATGGEALAGEVLDDAGRQLGLALGAVVALVDPAVVVLGGGLGSAAGTRYASAVDAAYAERVGERPEPPALVRAGLGARSGVLGAALLGFDAVG